MEAPTLSLSDSSSLAKDVRSLARAALSQPGLSPEARTLIRRRVARPIDYMRYAEFTSVLNDLRIEPGALVLDVGSPQWFSLYLASKHPETRFTYMNILPAELAGFAAIARALGLGNIDHRLGDVRELPFPDESFDRVVSISVLEHVHPEVGGDVRALEEIRRVLRPGGELLFTVPYKEHANVVFVDGVVYERDAADHNFFAHEYDRATFDALLAGSGLSCEGLWLICETPGAFAVDYYEWGPGRTDRVRSALVRSRILLQPLTGRSLDGVLARRYLRISRRPSGRLVNVSALLRKD